MAQEYNRKLPFSVVVQQLMIAGDAQEKLKLQAEERNKKANEKRRLSKKLAKTKPDYDSDFSDDVEDEWK